MREYTIDTINVNKSITVKANGCNAIEFINTGTDAVQINGRTIAVGGNPVTYYGLEGERDVTEYSIVFGGTTGPALLIVRKFYNK